MGKLGIGMLSGLGCFLLLSCFLFPGYLSAATCEKEIGEITKVKGFVEVKKSGETEWTRVQPKDKVCDGDIIRVKDHSNTEVRMENENYVTLHVGHFTFSKPEKEKHKLFEFI